MTYPERGNAVDGKRQSMTETYLPRASRGRGARAGRTPPRSDRDQERSATHAELTDTSAGDVIDGGIAVTIGFRDVIVCGGAIQTPAILQRAGFRHRVGRTLAVHPTVKLAARFDQEMNTPDDVSVHQVKEFSPEMSFGGSASQSGSDRAGAHRQLARVRRGGHVVAGDRGLLRGHHERGPWHRAGACRGCAIRLVTYRLTKRDRDLLGQGLARLALVMLEADADEVYPVVPRCTGRAQPRRHRRR